MTKVSVVILNWNGEKLLREFLPSVIANSPEWAEIVVIDNDSKDSSLSVLNNEFPEVRLVINPSNLGFAGGYNTGLKAIEAEYFVLLNSDVAVGKNWLEPMISWLDENKDFVAVQPKILSYRHPDEFEYAGAAGGFIDYLGFPFCRGRILNTLEKDSGQYEEALECFWASGACFTVRSADFFKAGGFDERFFAHMEEIDLCWRFRNAGFRIGVVPQSTIYHLGGGSLDALNPKKTFLNFRNNYLMIWKNSTNREFRRIMRKRYLLDKLAVLNYMVHFRFAHAKAALKAKREFRKMKADFLQVIDKNLFESKVVYPRSIIWTYYGGKKHFSRLKF